MYIRLSARCDSISQIKREESTMCIRVYTEREKDERREHKLFLKLGKRPCVRERGEKV